jgi:ABC-type branched-subunit amino acid transport system substrate-binding protein
MTRLSIHRRAQLALAAVAVAGAITACGSAGTSSSDPSSATATQSSSGASKSSSYAAAAASKLKGQPINVMIAATLDGPTNLPELPWGAIAAADRINSQGGIKGRPIHVIVCDDNNPSPDACARKAVAAHVAAVVGSESAGINPVLESNGIAQVGNFPFNPDDFTQPNSFPLSAGMEELGGAARLLASLGVKTILPLGTAGAPGIEHAVTELKTAASRIPGMRVLPEVGLPFGSTDLSAEVAKAAESGAQAIVVAGFPAQNVQVIEAARSQGVSQKLVFFGTGVTQELVGELKSAAEGIYITSSFRPLTSTNPAVTQFKQDMAKYAKGQELSDLSMNSWAAMQLFALAAKRVHTVDAASILKVMPTLKNVSLGVVAPFSFGNKGPIPTEPRIINFEGFNSQVKSDVITPLSETPVNAL